jgi:glutathione S-transferase
MPQSYRALRRFFAGSHRHFARGDGHRHHAAPTSRLFGTFDPMTSARLVTIPFSHFCEKARWGLDRTKIDYREEPHLPMLSWVPALRASRVRTVPVLVASGQVLASSHAILRYCHERAPEAGLYPTDLEREVEELEAVFDRRVGPAARRIAYGHLLPEPDAVARLFAKGVPAWEAALARVLGAPMRAGMKRGLRIDAAGVERSETTLAEILTDVERRLEDGRRWLFGDRFTAADLTFAALSTPLLAPATLERFLGSLDDAPPAFRERVERFRATRAGALAQRAYDTER